MPSTPASASASPSPVVKSTDRCDAPSGSFRGAVRLSASTSSPRAASAATKGLPRTPVPPTTATFMAGRILAGGSGGRLERAVELRRGDADDLSLEALLLSVDHPGGVDFADVEVESQLVRVLLDMLHVGQARSEE